jgi:hypothetical protein
MSEEIIEPRISLPGLLASLPRWARIGAAAVLLAECALLAAALAHAPQGDERSVRVGLPIARPAPGFSTL